MSVTSVEVISVGVSEISNEAVKGNAEESVCYGGGIVVVSIVVLPDPELCQLVGEWWTKALGSRLID